MRQNNVVFVFARGEKFRQNILIPDFHSLRFSSLLPLLLLATLRSYERRANDSQRKSEGETRVATRNLPLESSNEISYTWKIFGGKEAFLQLVESSAILRKILICDKNYCIIENIAFHSPATLSFWKEKKISEGSERIFSNSKLVVS